MAGHAPNQPAERHVGTFASATLPKYPDYNIVPDPNPPSYLPDEPISGNTVARQERGFRSQFETVLAVDDMIGMLHDELAADGRLDNTVWIFISDNGVGHMEHRWRSKACEYYVCRRVPFVVICPTGVCTGTLPGQVDEENYALNIDIAPTIADLAGVTPTLDVDGTSLVPVLENPVTPWRSEWFMHGNSPRYEGIVAIATDGDWYKYVELPTDGELEMYNLVDDPYEIVNLAGDSTYAMIETQLDDRLEAFINGDPSPNVAPTGSFTSSCVDADCNFTDTSTDTDGTVTSWDWEFGDNTTSTQQHPSQTTTQTQTPQPTPSPSQTRRMSRRCTSPISTDRR